MTEDGVVVAPASWKERMGCSFLLAAAVSAIVFGVHDCNKTQDEENRKAKAIHDHCVDRGGTFYCVHLSCICLAPGIVLKMKEDVSVVKLRARLVGKTVSSVEQSMLSESYYYIKTSDGESFHICGTELGSWIVDGPRHDGTFPSIGALAQAVGNHRYEKQMYDDPVEVVLVDGVLVVDAGDGELFRIRPSDVKDEWERKVLSHPKATQFMRIVAQDGLLWRSWFCKERAQDPGDENRVPEDLLLSSSELDARL